MSLFLHLAEQYAELPLYDRLPRYPEWRRILGPYVMPYRGWRHD